MTDALASTFFVTTIDAGVAHIEMNRPDKANAMTPDFWADLPRLVAALDADPAVRAIVLSGRGKHFSGGMDLLAFQGIMVLAQAEPARGAYAMRDLILGVPSRTFALTNAVCHSSSHGLRCAS